MTDLSDLPPAAPSPNTGAQGVHNLSIGVPVWFHSRDFDRFEQARTARIVGTGAQPNLVNLTIDCDPLIDVANKHLAPIIQRRNVPVFQDYPENWPMEDFAVFPFTASSIFAGEGAPHGGKRPVTVAGSVTRVKPFAESPAQPAIVRHGVIHHLEAGAQSGSLLIDPPVNEMDEIKPAPGMEHLVPKKPEKPKEPAPGEMAPPLVKLTQHPAWGRAFEDLELVIQAEGDTINIGTKEGLPLCQITHSPDGLKKGFILKAQKGAKRKGLDKVVEGARTSDDARKLILLAGKIAAAGTKATTPAQAAKAFDDAWTEAGETDSE